MSDVRVELLNSLLTLRSKVTDKTLGGICMNAVQLGADRSIELLSTLIKGWPDSLDPKGDFPIEGDGEGYAQSKGSKWNNSFEHGRRRRALLAYLIDQLEADIKENPFKG